VARRSFDDSFWGDTFVQGVERDAKLLFLYLWTNKRCNSAGLYEITPKTISFEADIPVGELHRLFGILKPKVVWWPNLNIVWVKNFLKHQPKSPQFLKNVADCLCSIGNNGIVKEFRDYYSVLGVSIPYRYPSDTIGRQYRYLLEPELELEQEVDIIGCGLLENGKDLKKYPPSFIPLRAEVFAGLKQRRDYTSRQPGAEAKAISQMLAENFTPSQILQAYDLIKQQPFFVDKNLSMMQVHREIHEVLKNGTHRKSPRQLIPRKSYTNPDL